MHARRLPWPVPGAIVAAAVACSGALALAQAPTRQPRVTIAAPAARIALRPPPPRVLARPVAGGMDVRSWLDRTEAPDTLEPSAGGTILLAHDLSLQDRQYRAPTPTLALVADSLTIGGNSTIDLSSAAPGGAGGTMLILARRIACAPGASLRIVANGGVAISRNGGGAGGNLVVAGSGSEALPSCISLAAQGGAGRSIVVRDHRTGAERPERMGMLPKGPDGVALAFPEIRAASQQDPRVRQAWSAWTIERLESLRVNVYEASRRRDDVQVLALFKDYESLPLPGDAIEPALRERYLAVLADLNRYRETAVPALSVEELLVQPGGTPQRVSVFTEGATLKSYLAPTHALAVRASVQGRPMLGLIDYRPERPDELSIETEWELTVDPWAQRLAAEQLAARGWTLDGMFAGWSLEARPMQEIGIRGGTATLLPGGKRLRVRIIADAARGNVVFWRLLNSTGLPWSVDWRFTEPRTGRTVSGTWAGPPLSMVRQQQPAVRVTGNALENTGSTAAAVNYVRVGDGQFAELNPVVRLEPGQQVPLPPSVIATGIPPEAVETALDPSRFGSDFYVLNGDQVLDRIVVRSALPAADDERGALDYLEVTLSTRVGAANGEAVTAGPFRLSASGTLAAEVSVPMLRLSQGAREVTLSGRAYYAGGGYRSLRPTTFDTRVIAVTADLLQ